MRLLLLLSFFVLFILNPKSLLAQCDTTDVLANRYDSGCLLSSGMSTMLVNPQSNFSGRFLNSEVSFDGYDFVFTPTRSGVFTLQYTDFDTCGSVVTRNIFVQAVNVGTSDYVPYDCSSQQAGSVDITVGVGNTIRELSTGDFYSNSFSSVLERYDRLTYSVASGQGSCNFTLPLVSDPSPSTASTSLSYDCDARDGAPTISVSGNPVGANFIRYLQGNDPTFRFQGVPVVINGPAEVNGLIYYSDGCRTEVSASIPESPAPKVDSGSDFALSCGRDSFYIPTTTLATGSSIQYAWTTNDGLIRDFADSSWVLIGSAGTYKVTLSNTVSGCSNSDSTIVEQSSIYVQQIRDTLCSGITSYQAIDTMLAVPGTHTVDGTSGLCDTLIRYRLSNRQPLAITVTTVSASGTMLGTASVSTNDGGSIASVAWSTGETGTQISGLAPGAYTVTVTDNFGCSSTIAFEIALISSTTNPLLSTWKMYPNPSSGAFQIELKSNHPPLLAKVYSLSGQLVHTTTIDQKHNSLSLPELAHGVYGVRLISLEGNDYGLRLLTIK